jgi:hypothetical protein
MGGRVIQGFFVSPRARPTAHLDGPRTSQRTIAANARRLPQPTLPAFAGQAAMIQARPAPGRPPLVHQAPQVAQPFGGPASFEIDPVQIGLARSGGQPLPQAVLAKMEAAFGADFSAVRVHVGPQAPRIGAVAFTMGNDLYFAPGRFQPDSAQGQQLIGHELAHVIQQRQGRVRAPGSGVAVVQDRVLEAEADRLGLRAAAHRATLAAEPLRVRAFSGGAPAGAQPVQPYLGVILGGLALAAAVGGAIWYGCGPPSPAGPPQPAGNAGGRQRGAVVTLRIAGNDYPGKSSGQYGHAEMAALYSFLSEYTTFDEAWAALSRRSRSVSCHNQPVCGSCTLVLQKLGFVTADAQTHFSDVPSGGVSWQASNKVRDFMISRGWGAVYAAALRAGAK